MQLGLASQYLRRRDIALFDVSTLTNMMKVLFHELMTYIPYKVVLLSRIDRGWRFRSLCGSLLSPFSRRPAPASFSVGYR